MYFYDDKYELALKEFNSVLKAWPHERRALRSRARLFASMGRCANAQDDLKILLEIEPTDAYSLKTKVICASN
jgi:regulator of sirC expression with transglutaminase-like and TPR domain